MNKCRQNYFIKTIFVMQTLVFFFPHTFSLSTLFFHLAHFLFTYITPTIHYILSVSFLLNYNKKFSLFYFPYFLSFPGFYVFHYLIFFFNISRKTKKIYIPKKWSPPMSFFYFLHFRLKLLFFIVFFSCFTLWLYLSQQHFSLKCHARSVVK